MATFYNFSKRLNETKQPSGAGTDIDVVFKEGVSIDNPVLLINSDISTFTYNYMYMLGSYYFINDVIQVHNDVIEIVCEKDPMATYKSQIGAVKCMIEYAASGFSEERSFLPDPRATMYGPPTVEDNTSATRLFSGNGMVIVTVAGKNTHHLGLCTPYAMDQGDMASLANKLFSDDLLTDLQKYFSDPYSAIIEAHWVPWNNTMGTSETVMLGSSSAGFNAIDLSLHPAIKGSTSIDVPWHYDTNTRYVTRSPYSKFVLHLPYYGELEIAPESLQNSYFNTLASTLYIDYAMDFISGEIIYYIHYGAESEYIKTVHASCGVQLPIGQTTGNTVKGISTAISGAVATGIAVASMVASGGASAPAVGAAIGGVAATGVGIATAFTENVSGGGTYGSFAAYNIDQLTAEGFITLSLKCWKNSLNYGTPADFYTSCGYPLFAGGTISSYSGFIKCSNASVSIPGSNADREKINAYMNNGFYYN